MHTHSNRGRERERDTGKGRCSTSAVSRFPGPLRSSSFSLTSGTARSQSQSGYWSSGRIGGSVPFLNMLQPVTSVAERLPVGWTGRLIKEAGAQDHGPPDGGDAGYLGEGWLKINEAELRTEGRRRAPDNWYDEETDSSQISHLHRLDSPSPSSLSWVRGLGPGAWRLPPLSSCAASLLPDHPSQR